MEKVSNTEKLAGLIIKILKGIGILLLICVVAVIASILLFTLNGRAGSGNAQVVGEVVLSLFR